MHWEDNLEKIVAGVVGDAGGFGEVLASREAIEKQGIHLKWFADPAGEAIKKLVALKIPHESRGPNPEDNISAILVGTSATESGLGNRFSRYGSDEGIPTFWIADMIGTENKPSQDGYAPNAGLFVLNEAHADNARMKRRHTRMIPVGKPSFAQMGKDLPAILADRIVRRQAIGVGEADILVVYWSGGELAERAIQQSRALCDAFIGLTHSVRYSLAARLHGKLGKLSLDPRPVCRELVQKANCRLVQADQVDGVALTAIADIILADSGGTEGLRSIALGKPTGIFFNLPDDTKRLREVFPDGIPPHVACGAAAALNESLHVGRFLWEASQACGLRMRPYPFMDVTRQMLEPDPAKRLKAAAPYVKLLEPGADELVAKEIERVITSRAV